MPGRVSVLNSRELEQTLSAIHAMPLNVQRRIRTETKKVAESEWKESLRDHAASSGLRQSFDLIVASSKIAVSNQNIRVRAATSPKKAIRGGAIPAKHGKAYEFGTPRGKKRTYSSRRGSTRFKVTRRTAEQVPSPRRRGYVFYPAVAEMTPRILALWVQTSVRTVHDAFEGKQ